MKKKMCAVCAVIGVMLLGSATAFFTDRGSATNEFIVGNVSVDLTEPRWNPDEGTALTPNKTVKKDPQVTNTGSNDAFVFLQVKVPTVLNDEQREALERFSEATTEGVRAWH